MSIPIIDLFAGPGGLGEGFAALRDVRGRPIFRLGISIEKESSAHSTLLLRAVYRLLDGTSDERHYYDYVRGSLSRDKFLAIPAVARAFREAETEARQFELGKTKESQIDEEIRRALGNSTSWVLIGGPPCQAYSLAGRARRTNDATFSDDVKHFLYREYLRIIRAHRPAIFVMENVKGLLSSKHSGVSMFSRIIDDLALPHDGVEYDIRSFVCDDRGLGLAPGDYLIQAEKYGIPQARHRVILLGVRKSDDAVAHELLAPMGHISVRQAIWDLPALRSRLSRGEDSPSEWHKAVSNASRLVRGWTGGFATDFSMRMKASAASSASLHGIGQAFVATPPAKSSGNLSAEVEAYRAWVLRPKVGGILQHEARSHMEADLARYLFAATYAREYARSPKLPAYPPLLLPEHRNASGGSEGGPIPFPDRFRVQCGHEPSSTIVSHIAKDGHYYIHYDPVQCRSLTVREAARLQTFPDDYFFEGTRTQQYIQVGNAVPPLLANRIATIVWKILARPPAQGTSSRFRRASAPA